MPKKSVFNKTRRLRGGGETEMIDKLTGIEAKLTGIEAKLAGIAAMFSGDYKSGNYGKETKISGNFLKTILEAVAYENSSKTR